MHTPSDHNKVPAIMISTDRGIFINESSVRERMKGYGKKYDSLSIIVFALKKHALPKEDCLVEGDAQNASGRVEAYSTNAWLRLCYMPRAFWQGMQRINTLADVGHKTVYITTQDPFETGLVGVLLAWYGTYVCGLTIRRNVDIHGDIYSPYFRKSSYMNYPRLIMAPWIYRGAASIRVVSDRIRTSLLVRHVPDEKIEVKPIFVSFETLRTTHPQWTPRERYAQFDQFIFMAGRLAPEKNYYFALRVFAEVLSLVPEKKKALCIAGDGPLKERLEAYARKLGIADSVIFLGVLANHDMVAWYKGCDVFLHTSVYEGYGMVLAEACTAGCSIVTSDVGIASELRVQNEDTTQKIIVYPVEDKRACLAGLVSILT